MKALHFLLKTLHFLLKVDGHPARRGGAAAAQTARQQPPRNARFGVCRLPRVELPR